MNIDVLHSWIDVIETHGLSLVLFLVLLLAFFIPRYKKLEKKNDEQQSSDDATYMEKIVKIEKQIMLILAQVLDEVGADWAVLWQFHNGTYTTFGIPFIFLSVTHEVVKRGKALRGELYQKQPQSIFIDVLEKLLKDPYVRLDRNCSTPAVVASYIRDGVHCGYVFKIVDANARMIAIMSVSFARNKNLTEKELVSLMGYAARISLALAEMKAYYVRPNRRKMPD